METGVVIVYDGSFNGFLTVVFRAFEEKLLVADIQPKEVGQKEFFSQTLVVDTNIDNAKQVWYTLRGKAYEALKNMYFAFLSETTGIEHLLYLQILKILNGEIGNPQAKAGRNLIKIEELATQVACEKRKWESQLTLNFPKGKPPVAYISPKFNVLPLISKYFRLTYPSVTWIIFDKARNYGILCNGSSVRFVREIPAHFLLAEAA